ncbi:MAG: hypothetical protein J6R47_01735 [Acholeplasmatales bacterium]|nr:hypothetical protein [Acholeplasmatales bacterium]
MSFYNKLADIIQDDYLNQEKGELFNIKYLDNTAHYDLNNLISEEQLHGVLNLVSSTTSTLSDTGQENKVDIMQLEIFIPLNQEATYHSNVLLNGLRQLSNTFHTIDDEIDVQINDVQIIQDAKYNGFINGNEYEHIIVQFTSLVTVDFLYSNNGVLKIDDEVVDCKSEVVLGVNAILDGKMTADGIQRGQSNGIQYGLTVILTYNKNNSAHRKMLRNWMLKDKFNISYTLDVLEFNRVCQMTNYTMNAITGDTVKLTLVFQEAPIV